MDADDEQLVIRVQAEDDENFGRVKYVVPDHPERFSGDAGLRVQWGEGMTTDVLQIST